MNNFKLVRSAVSLTEIIAVKRQDCTEAQSGSTPTACFDCAEPIPHSCYTASTEASHNLGSLWQTVRHDHEINTLPKHTRIHRHREIPLEM